MKVQFSSSALGFFAQNMIDDNSYDDDLPDDLIELTDREFLTYWKKNPPQGKTLAAIDGRPAWVDLPPSTHEELVASANAKKSQLKSVADSEIEWQQDAVNDGSASDREIADLAAWRKYRVALMRVDTSKAPDIEWPDMP
ncbi:tail fiber assembly protein [Yersinia enterocolitica]|nr:tail fiber assembly protein [Yersinia enterocolitica]EKN4899502.1 tail fiber assembly protein [Yersinia enterocolitica]